MSPAKRRETAERVRRAIPEISERRLCRVLGQARSTQRRKPAFRDDEDALTRRIVELAAVYGRYGYRRVTALLRRDGWRVNHKRVERIWRKEGLKVPCRQRKRGRIWLNDGSCVRHRAEFVNHVWSYDFVHDRTRDGRPLRFLTLVDEYSRECLALQVSRSLKALDVLECLSDLFLSRGVPQCIRSDNGPEFVATALREWLGRLSVKPLFIEPGSPWENGYIESFNGKFRDEFLSVELFESVLEARVLTERWRRHYNEERPHSALGYRPPAPEAWAFAPTGLRPPAANAQASG